MQSLVISNLQSVKKHVPPVECFLRRVGVFFPLFRVPEKRSNCRLTLRPKRRSDAKKDSAIEREREEGIR